MKMIPDTQILNIYENICSNLYKFMQLESHNHMSVLGEDGVRKEKSFVIGLLILSGPW